MRKYMRPAEKNKILINYPKLAASIIIPLAAGFIGSLFTTSSIPTWYSALNKPSFSPPNWIFFPVWTVLYILMGIALYVVWQKGTNVKAAMSIFGTQLALNVLWPIIFFGMRSPFYALIEILVLWVSIALTIRAFWKISKTAGNLLIPYILWVSFAAFLNYSVWMLNP